MLRYFPYDRKLAAASAVSFVLNAREIVAQRRETGSQSKSQDWEKHQHGIIALACGLNSCKVKGRDWTKNI